MRRRNGGCWRAWTTLLAALLLWGAQAAKAQETALDRYVARPDPAYSWRLAGSYPGFGATTHVLELTSQTWREPGEVDRTLWKHWLLVTVPILVTSRTAVLTISGGNNSGSAPAAHSDELGLVGLALGAVAAELRMTPNQPLRFAGDDGARSEDAIIAYSWDRFLRGGDETWPAQLPMVKGAVRAMDAVTEFCAQPAGGGHTIESYVVSGASKRGWTTWLTAAVDDRVIGIAPAVIDVLNLGPSFLHHWRVYGFWAPAIRDYDEAGIMTWMGTPRYEALKQIVDPYEYRDRFAAIPKYLINAAGDEFFVGDSSRFYFDDLPGTKFLRYVPNSGHDISASAFGDSAVQSGLAFFDAILRGRPLPEFTWELPEDGRILLKTVTAPVSVKLWRATNPAARDFRLETIGTAWIGSDLPASAPGTYEARVDVPAEGWTAFFIEMTYPSGGLLPLVFTTPIRVAPDTYANPPFATTVSAANFLPPAAPEAIVSIYGPDLAASIEVATALPLPVELGGTSVRVIDSQGATRQAPLFFVSPGQVNYLMPAGLAPGVAVVEVLRNGTVVVRGQAMIQAIAPGVFSANANGEGVAAALSVTALAAGGDPVIAPIFDATAPEGSRAATPVGLGGQGVQVYLSLYGTGMRGASLATATVGGEAVGVAGPAESPEFAGVDQVNLGPLPRSLQGRGEVDIRVWLDGQEANTVTVVIE